jgi:hypothetical protein
MELWAQDQLTCLTVFFSTADLEQLSNEAARDLLEREGVLKNNPGSSYRSAYARPLKDSSGNPIWSVNVVLAAEEDIYADAPGPFLPYGEANQGGPTTRIGRDVSLRWAFRTGDYLLWIRSRLGDTDASAEIIDLWELQDGDHALLTNRRQDIPKWFELDASEVRNSELSSMTARLAAGEEPGPKTDGANVWRAMAGDWLLWVGQPRAGEQTPSNGFLLARVDENLLVLGDGPSAASPMFGAQERDGFPPDTLVAVRAGMAEVRRQGPRRSIATEWVIG